jgi:DNA-binding MarR family transcriptional regulator
MIDNGIYKMWYAGWNGISVRILYATSSDGENWVKSPFNPVLNLGFPGEPDDTHVDSPKVIKDGGIYKMWYAGNDSVSDRLMYAESFDGINWTGRSVVLPDQGVIPNTVLKDGNTYELWYQRRLNGRWRIYYAISYDGINWIKQGMALDLSDPSELDNGQVSGAAVLKEDENTYKMWYSGHNDTETYRIFHAISNNGIDWTREGLAMDIGESGDEDEGGVAYPCVIKGGIGSYKMWYNGWVGTYDMNVMYAVSQESIKDYGSLTSVKISLPSGQTWKDLEIDKRVTGKGSHLYVSILDGETYEPILGFENLSGSNIDISSVNDTIHPTIRLQAFFVGDGSSSPVLKEWGVTWINPEASTEVTPDPLTANESWAWAAALIAASAGVILFLITFGGTEWGKYKIFPVIFPLYTRLKKEEILDQFTRGKIYEYIMGHPGDHYNSIREELNLNNGVLTYHLRILEREDYIRSMRDGIYKRFYPVDAKVQRVNGFGNQSVQGRIIMYLIQKPGLSQKEISKALGTSQQVVSYHLNLMIETGHVRAIREGKILRYYVNKLIPVTNM